jgi:hypothetical protein
VANAIYSDGQTIEAALRYIGAPLDRVIRLSPDDGINAANFEYADLLKCGELGQRVAAVIEKDGSPLIYLAHIPEDSPDIGIALAQLLGNRGETSLLLDVHWAINTKTLTARAWPCKLDVTKSHSLDLTNPIDANSILGDLQEGLWGTSDNAYQEQRLRDLLVNSVDTVSAALRKTTGIAPNTEDREQEVLALVGRALFTRFLLDRGILAQNTAPKLWKLLGNNGAAAFDAPLQAAYTCEWLDRTFNGEFMPLCAKKNDYEDYFSKLIEQSPKALEPLGWILHRTNAGGQLPLWEKLDFSHIPAGTLSEVYENYAHRKAPGKAKRESVHFTPRHIARMMVRQALSGVAGLNPLKEAAANAKILDPAVGAAVFLSLAYRELARHYALYHEKWPDTQALRTILYTQLQGLDINLSALNLAALTLYLTAIELDENPAPPEKLKFEKRLIGTVLLDVSVPSATITHTSELGSIRSDLQLGRLFDVVIGNPPWTSLGRKDLLETEQTSEGAIASDAFAREAESIATRCIARRDVVLDGRYAHPDKVPDIALLWKATEWAKEETGIISLIVHQRLLIKQSKSWRLARQALFSSIQIDGIINAGEFANHDKLIWPGIESPFCVLFARNRKPPQNHKALMLSLAVEPTLKWRRQIRLDPLSTISVSMADFDERPGGLVARTKGCELDRALLQRWFMRTSFKKESDNLSLELNNPRRLPLTTIGTCISKIALGEPKRGFKTGKKNTSTPKWFDNLPKSTKELTATAKERIAGPVIASSIKREFIHRPFKSSPSLEWYCPPFLLLRHNPGPREEMARTILVMSSDNKTPVLYPYTFIGIPLKQDKNSLLYAKFLAVWINSSFYSYYQTLTSTQFTFGIKVSLNDEILDTPVMEMQQAIDAKLTDPAEIERLFERLAYSDQTLLADIDVWAYKILGADAHEQRLIKDTLSVSYPIGPSRQSGKAWVTPSKVAEYTDQLKAELVHHTDLIDIESVSIISPISALAGWRFLRWKLNASSSVDINRENYLETINDDELIHLVRMNYPQGELWAASKDGWFVFGQLALNRLWLPSRACMTADVMAAWADKCVT